MNQKQIYQMKLNNMNQQEYIPTPTYQLFVDEVMESKRHELQELCHLYDQAQTNTQRDIYMADINRLIKKFYLKKCIIKEEPIIMDQQQEVQTVIKAKRVVLTLEQRIDIENDKIAKYTENMNLNIIRLGKAVTDKQKAKLSKTIENTQIKIDNCNKRIITRQEKHTLKLQKIEDKKIAQEYKKLATSYTSNMIKTIKKTIKVSNKNKSQKVPKLKSKKIQIKKNNSKYVTQVIKQKEEIVDNQLEQKPIVKVMPIIKRQDIIQQDDSKCSCTMWLQCEVCHNKSGIISNVEYANQLNLPAPKYVEPTKQDEIELEELQRKQSIKYKSNKSIIKQNITACQKELKQIKDSGVKISYSSLTFIGAKYNLSDTTASELIQAVLFE